MRKLLFVLFVLLIGLFSCKSTKPQLSRSIEQKSPLKIEILKGYKLGESLSIQLTNVSQENLVLYYPSKPKIQKKEGDNWRRIRILDCPCDAPCNAPPDKIDFPIGKKISLKWNQEESYCGKRDEAGIRKTIRKKCEKGEYRLVTTYKLEGKKNIIYNEFIIN